jgi:hypothetical protein
MSGGEKPAVRRVTCTTYLWGYIHNGHPMALVDRDLNPSRAETVFD